MFLDHTQWRSTVGRTPLDERSARHRDLYLTTHDTHNRQISMPLVGFEPKISAGELRSWVWIPPGAWIFVCCECRVLSGRDLCDEPITRPEESYRLCCVIVCDLETSWMRSPWPSGDCRAKNEQTNIAEVSRPVLKLNPFRTPVKLPAILLSSTWMSFLPSDSLLQYDNFTIYL
jgi:hypothetical protein